MKLKNIFFTVLMIIGATVYAQGYHVSSTKIEQSPTGGIDVAIKFTSDDLEEGLKAAGINASVEKDDSNSGIVSLVQRGLKIQVNGGNKSLSFKGKSITGKAAWVYFEITGISDINSISIENTLLNNVFRDQQNLINLNLKNKRETIILKDGKVSVTYNL